MDELVKPSVHTFDVFTINSISEGKESLGDVTIKISAYGRTFTGRGLSTDIIEASVNAYLKSLNRMAVYEKKLQEGA